MRIKKDIYNEMLNDFDYKITRKEFWITMLVLVAMIAGVIAVIFGGFVIEIPKANAAIGLIEETITCNRTGFAAYSGGTEDYWSVIGTSVVGYSGGAGLTTGFSCDTVTDKYDDISRSFSGWYLSANLTDISQVVSVTVRARLASNYNNFTLGQIAGYGWHVYHGTPNNGWFGAYHLSDYYNMRPSILVSDVHYSNTLPTPPDWVEWVIDSEWWETVLDIDNGRCYMALCDTFHDYGSAPTWEYGKETYATWSGFASGFDPELVIEYYGELPERTEISVGDLNDDGTVVSSNETAVCTSANWSTPRCAYSDEPLFFEVYGDTGADFTAQLITDAGVVLDTIDDRVRSEGFRNVGFEVPESFEGLVRCRELTYGLSSPWGYVALSPDDSQEPNYIYSESTEYPQYSESFSSYVVQAGDIMQIHWKTYLTSDDTDDVNLQLWYLADNTTVVYDENFSDLIDDYYLMSIDTIIEKTIGWRYALFVMNDTGSGWNDRDDLLQNLNITYGSSTSGFYQPVLVSVDDGEWTTTHSAYWYLTDNPADHLYCYADSYDDDEMLMRVYAGTPTKVLSDLNSFNGYILDSSGDVTFTFSSELTSKETAFIIPIPLSAGDFTIYYEFIHPFNTYVYIKTIALTVEEGGEIVVDDGGGLLNGDEITSWIQGILSNYGLDNAGGHWLVILVLCAIITLLFWKIPIVATVLVLCVFGWAMVTEFIDRMVALLLILGAAGTIFLVFKRSGKIFSKSEEETED